MTTTIEREFLGRSQAGGRVGIYREQADWETRVYVGRDAELPCAIRRWWSDSTCTFDMLWFDDLGRPTVSTSIAIAAALTGDVHNNYRVHRHRWDLYVEGVRFPMERCTWGCGLSPRDCGHCHTRGVYDVLNRRALVWPWTPYQADGVSWRQIVQSGHFDFTNLEVRG